MLWQKRAIPLKAEYFNAEDAKNAEESLNPGGRNISCESGQSLYAVGRYLLGSMVPLIINKFLLPPYQN
jgi:hypothetical protein